MLIIIEEVAKAGVPVTPTEINQIVGLPKQTIHRLFSTLEEEGFLQRSHDGRSYSCGRRLTNVAIGVLSSERIRAVRLAILGRLSEVIGETCNLAIPEREAMLYLDRVDTKWPLRIQLPIGTKVPFHCTASGKMFLSMWDRKRLDKYLSNASFVSHTEHTIVDIDALRDELDDIQACGYAKDDEEFMEGMVALAVPVLSPSGQLFSTVSFHAPKVRMDVTQALNFLDPLKQAALELADMVEAD